MFALRTDNQVAHLAAIRAGYGIGICQVPIGRRETDLVRLLPRQFGSVLDIWLVMYENLRASPRQRAVFDNLRTTLVRGYRSTRVREDSGHKKANPTDGWSIRNEVVRKWKARVELVRARLAGPLAETNARTRLLQELVVETGAC
jgi:hypothetical protein